MTKIGVGIIGNGMATRVFHAPYIATVPTLTLRKVVSRRAEMPPPAPGVMLVGDVASVLDDPAIDLVVIATPSATHATLAQQALEAGKHVVLEKPFALNLAEAQALVNLAAARGRLLTAFHNRRWDSDFLTMRAALATGLIGDVVHFASHFDRFRPALRDRWREDGGAGSGVWYDLGPHLIDQALLLFGQPVAVDADIAALRPGGQADDFAHVTLHYPDKRVTLHASMCVAGGSSRFIAHGLQGSLVKIAADPQEAQSIAGIRPDAPEWGVDLDPLRHWDGDGVVREMTAQRGCQQQFYALLADACHDVGPAPTLPREILAVQAILDLARSASECGQRLAV